VRVEVLKEKGKIINYRNKKKRKKRCDGGYGRINRDEICSASAVK